MVCISQEFPPRERGLFGSDWEAVDAEELIVLLLLPKREEKRKVMFHSTSSPEWIKISAQ
jgi:hypothetical protein